MTAAGRLNRRLVRLAVGRRAPRRTVRVRLMLLYGGLFLLSGAALVAVTYALFQRATEYTKPRLPRIPHAPAIENPRLLPPLAQTLPQLRRVQYQLAQDQHQLGASAPPSGLAEHLAGQPV